MPGGPVLIVFGGLPGAGKTTLSRALARRVGAAYLRVDTIEQALRRAGLDPAAAGYTVAQALAAEILPGGGSVVVDAVNPVAASRAGFRDAAGRAGARLLRVEIRCSDPAEHRRRVEGRVPDIAGHRLPRWDDVTALAYEPWPDADLVIDTARLSPDEAVARIAAALGPGAETQATSA